MKKFFYVLIALALMMVLFFLGKYEYMRNELENDLVLAEWKNIKDSDVVYSTYSGFSSNIATLNVFSFDLKARFFATKYFDCGEIRIEILYNLIGAKKYEYSAVAYLESDSSLSVVQMIPATSFLSPEKLVELEIKRNNENKGACKEKSLFLSESKSHYYIGNWFFM